MLHCGVAPDSSERRNMALIRTSNPVLNAKAFAGLALGGLSALLESKYPGIAMQAVACTFATFAAMFLAYRSGLIKATEKFKLGVVIETGVTAGAPKFMEWYGAFGLMVTLIWLYLEILRLLAKSRSRR